MCPYTKCTKKLNTITKPSTALFSMNYLLISRTANMPLILVKNSFFQSYLVNFSISYITMSQKGGVNQLIYYIGLCHILKNASLLRFRLHVSPSLIFRANHVPQHSIGITSCIMYRHQRRTQFKLYCFD